jgi:hypothetical protein
MRPTGLAAGVLALVALTGCGGDVSSDSAKPTESPSTTASTPTPEPAATYVPRAGDPKTHVLHVRILDFAGIDAYKQSGRKCELLYGRHWAVLVIAGPTAEVDSTPLKELDIPATAEPGEAGACVATLTVTVPYAPRYRLGIAHEGHGIANGYEPEEPWITTRGSSQKVTVVSQVVTGVVETPETTQ